MHKKLSVIMIAAIFLITSVGIISAVDDSIMIPVKIVWDSDFGNHPDEITVNLIKDDKIIDTVKLNATGSWNDTFKADDYDDYQVKEVISDDYSAKITGDSQKGFVITNKLVKDDVLGLSGDESQSGDDSNIVSGANKSNNNKIGSSADGSAKKVNSGEIIGATNATGNSTNNTANNTNSTNSADSKNSSEPKDDSGDVKDSPSKTTKVKTTITTKLVKQDDDKKQANTTKTKKNNTGLPIIVLILAVFVAAVVPFSRKK